MSFLDRLRHGHLSDGAFAQLWAEGTTHPHLDGCVECRERYAAFTRWLTGVGDAMRQEADDLLTPDRLAAQQAQIGRRLEALARPVRVIAFPKAARAVISGHSHVRRWVTVAAAACLVAGFGLGQVFPLRQALRQERAAPPPALTLPRTAERAAALAPASTPVNDEELLTDAFARSRVSTLSALDDMTPHARDTVLNRRNK